MLDPARGRGARREQIVRGVIRGDLPISAIPAKFPSLRHIVYLYRENPAQAMSILDLTAAKRKARAEAGEQEQLQARRDRRNARVSDYRRRLRIVERIAELEAGRDLTAAELIAVQKSAQAERAERFKAFRDEHSALGYKTALHEFTELYTKELEEKFNRLVRLKEEASKPESEWAKAQRLIEK
jgi:hypothetical protein